MPRVCLLAILSLAVSCTSFEPEALLHDVPEISAFDANEVSGAIRTWNLKREPAPLALIRVVPVHGVPGLFVARLDYQEDWCGSFGCYWYDGRNVTAQAIVDEEPDEQSIYSVRGIASAQIQGPLIEVIGRTHMGNGNLYVYELSGTHLKLLLKSRAYDCNRSDRWTFRDSVLKVVSRGKPLEVEVSGQVDEFAEDGPIDDKPITSFPCRKVFVWSAREHKFEQDLTRRVGFDRYRDGRDD